MDRKIDNGYYTFIDGRMQTGWINVAEAGFVSSSTPSNEAATADNSATDTVSLNDFRYYDPENGGRRASGWYTIEGAPASAKKKSHFPSSLKTEPLTLPRRIFAIFTINSERYCFNERGEMQTGLEPETGGWKLRLLLLRRRRRDAYRQSRLFTMMI